MAFGFIPWHLAALLFIQTITDPHPKPGKVNYIQHAGPNWDRYTSSPDEGIRLAIRRRISRLKTYTPYFDHNLSWMPNAWVYFDSFAIYTKSQIAREHPEWILKDLRGQKLFIGWGCSGGTCPQYAGDISNPLFVAHQIAEMRRYLAATNSGAQYLGLFVDDVNLEPRIGDGNGSEVTPVDARTHETMQPADWRRYFAEYMESVRRAFPPPIEIVHNSIWFAGGESHDLEPYVRREILSADYINLERGFGDPGLTGGNGRFSLRSLFSFINAVHAENRAIVVDDYHPRDTLYSLAAYFLVQEGNDGFGVEEQTLDDWPKVYEIDLGAPLGKRYEWQGLLRRDFIKGFVLLNEPGGKPVQVELPSDSRDVNGLTIHSLELPPRSGGLFLH